MQQMKLMLVDDEERFLLTTQKVLTRKGYKVLTAASGADALELLKHNTVHVVILDVLAVSIGFVLKPHLCK